MKRAWFLGGLLVVALLVAGLLSHFASDAPDGLERVAEDMGFLGHARDAPYGVMPDYAVGGSWLGRTWPGIAGTLVVLALASGAGWLIRRRSA